MCKWSVRLSNIEGQSRIKTVKYLSLAFVIIFLLHGLITIALSIWLEVSNVRSCSFVTDEPYWAPVHIQLSAGCLTVIICVSSLVYTLTQRANGFVRVFSCLLITIIVLEISSAIVASVMNLKLDDHLKQGILGSLSAINRTDHGLHGTVKCWTQIQTQYECCGVDNYVDWQNTLNSSAEQIRKIWDSCDCHGERECDTVNGQNKYSSGCYTKLKDRIRFVLTFTRFFGPTFAVFQMLAYLALNIILSKLYKQSVIAAYTAKDSARQSSSENCHIARVS